MISKIECLIEWYENKNKTILEKKPNLINQDGLPENSPEGVEYHLNEIFIKELQIILYGRF
jgi:hypothetical protein